MIKLGNYTIVPTKFPDGTQQVWKIPEEALKINKVTWYYESDSELITLCQLSDLLKCDLNNRYLELFIPTLPYARQDKPVSNYSTFGLKTLTSILNKYYDSISTIDIHSYNSFIENISPDERISEVIYDSGAYVICFPDKGASLRKYPTYNRDIIVLDKKRDQLTGEIIGLSYGGNLTLTGASVLIIDDICDGGRTFIEATKLLKELGATEVCLYTTHGLYTKGTKILFDSGIDRIFNYKGEILK